METKIVKKDGINHICVDGKIIDTVAFKSFRPTLNNVGDFYKAGVRLFHVYCSGLKSGIKMPYSAYGETWFGDGDYAKNPTPYVKATDVCALGRFSDSRECAVAVKKNADYNVFFSALGNLSHETLRGIAKMAGVHIYVKEGVFTYINDAVAGVYNTNAAFTELTLPKDGEYMELFSGKIYKTQNKKVVLPTDECPAQMLILK